MKHTLRSLALTAALSAGVAAMAQPPYTVTVGGQVSGCTGNSFVNIVTLPGTVPALDIDVPVLPPSCTFSATLNLANPTGGFIISTPCQGAIQTDTVLYETDPVLDSAMVYVVINCGNNTPDCLGAPGGSALPGAACTTFQGIAGTWSTDCQCVPNASSCQACFTVASPAPWTIAMTNCTSGGVSPYTFLWSLPDGSTSTSSNQDWTFTTEGVYGICLTITDADGCSSWTCDTVVVDANGGISTDPVIWDCLQIPNGPNVPGTPCTNTATGATGTWSANCECITNTTGCQAGFWVLQAYEGDSLSGEVTPIPYELWVWNLSNGTSPFQFLWNFGDGTSSTDPYPTHVYAQSGPYQLCLTLTDAAGCTSTSCDSVSIDGNGLYDGMAPVEEAARNGFTIRVVSQQPTGIADRPAFTETRLWPNPVNDVLNIRFNTSLRGNLPMSVIDVNGREVLVANAMIADGTNQLEVATGALPAGMYMLRMGNGNETMSFRFVKN
jgi:PKD repeat protein